MTKTELAELADRCEKASEPDRELDARIVEALGYRRTVEREGEVWRYYGSGPLGNFERLAKATLPRFTASLDAAMLLLPDSTMHMVQDQARKEVGWVCYAAINIDPENALMTFEGGAATPALALCAASLRAIASLEDEG
jgi:hypothetical protein